MKIGFRLVFIIIITLLFSHIFSSFGIAGVDLPWSTTYNCPDWNQWSDTLNCNGLDKGGNWATQGGHWAQITSAANNPNGGGGKGLRNWAGDGKNDNSGGVILYFSTPQTELWIRWYIKYQLGFQWNPISYDKWLYFDTGANGSVVFEPFYADRVRWGNYSGVTVSAPTGTGWNTIMANGGTYLGVKTSDGQWHCIEIHMKRETVGNQNGIAEYWLDGVLKYSNTNVIFGAAGTGWSNVRFKSNQDSPANGQDEYIDFDDMVISSTGYIGPLGNPNPPPSPPTNLRIIGP